MAAPHEPVSIRSEAELLVAVTHIIFELHTVFDDAERMVLADERHDAVAYVAFLEAMLVHLRNLIEFLFHSPRNDAISASDFCPDWKKGEARKASLSAPTAWNEISTHLSHLSWKRVNLDLEVQAWDWFGPLKSVADGFQLFLKCLPDSSRGWFVAAVDQSARRIEAIAGNDKTRTFTATTSSTDSVIMTILPIDGR